jgi:hypothetical protein
VYSLSSKITLCKDETMFAFAVGVKYIRYIVRYFYDPIFFLWCEGQLQNEWILLQHRFHRRTDGCLVSYFMYVYVLNRTSGSRSANLHALGMDVGDFWWRSSCDWPSRVSYICPNQQFVPIHFDFARFGFGRRITSLGMRPSSRLCSTPFFV